MGRILNDIYSDYMNDPLQNVEGGGPLSFLNWATGAKPSESGVASLWDMFGLGRPE
jgi:hypothetical protein